jgi:hypothetical protein
MSVESKIGGVTRDVVGAVVDAVNFNLAKMLKNEMNLTDDQILRITSVVSSTATGTAMNGVNQYVAAFNDLQRENEAPKKNRLFG